MGKPVPKVYPKSERPDGRAKLLGTLAILAGVLLLLIIGLVVYQNFFRPQKALPEAPQVVLPPLPAAPGLPEKKVTDTPAPGLPETKVVPPAAPALPQAPPPPQKQEPSGTVTWAWQLYQIPLTFVVTVPTPGYQTVALGVTIWNQSTENVLVSNEQNQFTVNVDNKIYASEIWSTASAVFGGLPYMVPTTLAPGGTVGGYTVFMIPQRFNAAMANWQVNVPPTVKVVRIDPKVPVIASQQPQAQPAMPQPRLPEDE
jgi:hypothetical protein